MNQIHTAKEWQEIVSQQKSSTLSQKAYCKENNIALTTFAYWKRKLLKAPAQKEKSFVKLNNPPKSSNNITLHIGNYFKLEITDSIHPDKLQRIVQTLKACL